MKFGLENLTTIKELTRKLVVVLRQISDKIEAVEFSISDISSSISTLFSRGYIEESGSNVNGEYIKFSDGTMICYGPIVGNVSSWIASGSIFRRDIGGFSYPEAFLNKPSIKIDTDVSQVWASPRSRSNSTCASTIWTYSNSTPTGNYDLYFTAVGRWKA